VLQVTAEEMKVRTKAFAKNRKKAGKFDQSKIANRKSAIARSVL
jgi:hypothetical protein